MRRCAKGAPAAFRGTGGGICDAGVLATGSGLGRPDDALRIIRRRGAIRFAIAALRPECRFPVAVGERPHGAREGRAALHATMGDVLQIAHLVIAVGPHGRDRGNCHPVSTVWAGK